jgi:hypothetical protein
MNDSAPARTRARRVLDLGGLRLALLLAVVVLLIVVPAPGTRGVLSGWPLVKTVLAPVLAPMLFMLLLLDALMARVFMSDATGDARRRFKTAVLVNLTAAALLLLRWLPYYLALRA